MTNNVLCDEFAERLADLLERDIDEATRGALEAHALSCGECGSLLADLRKLRIDASNLPTLTPERDLWGGIAERIDAPVIPLHVAAMKAVRTPRGWHRYAALGAAAVVLVAVSSMTTRYLTVQRGATGATAMAANQSTPDTARGTGPSARVAAGPTTPDSGAAPAAPRAPTTVRQQPPASTPTRLVSSKPSAEEVYATEIAGLHKIVQQRRAQLDPVTLGVIERNLRVIDDAIDQCKRALAKDPASHFLMQSLNNALETKIELLRTAALLPARS
jgi:hypothetical protein